MGSCPCQQSSLDFHVEPFGVTGGVPRVPTESSTLGESILDNMFSFLFARHDA
jgi:hypothetical protein